MQTPNFLHSHLQWQHVQTALSQTSHRNQIRPIGQRDVFGISVGQHVLQEGKPKLPDDTTSLQRVLGCDRAPAALGSDSAAGVSV